MPRNRQYASNADRQRAYRARQQRRVKRMELAAKKRNTDGVTIRSKDFTQRELLEAVDFIERRADEIIEPDEEDYVLTFTLRWMIREMRKGIV